ncbi:MAG: ABC transporter permease, partial [Calditrichaeota bacterium]
MQQILYLIQKEFRQVFRDKAMLFILFFVPLVQMIVLGFAITVDIKNVRTVIVDYDESPLSAEISRRFAHNPYFTVVAYPEAYSDIRESLDGWRAQIAIVIPHDFARDLARGLHPKVQVVIDGVDGNTAGIALGYAQGIFSDLAVEFISSHPRMLLSRGRASAVNPQNRMWYNLDLESKNYMVPGLIAVLLTVIGMFLSSMGLVREKEVGTLEQLMVTTIKTWQLILGKVLPFLFLGIAELGLMLLVA